MFNDTEWMGSDAHLAPLARAGLGILLERHDWSWWGNPRLVGGALDRVVPRHGIAKWGGDPSVLEAHKWLAPWQAIAIAEGMQSLQSRTPLRIKIARDVWNWPNVESGFDDIYADLGKAVGTERIFAEWPRDTRRRFSSSAYSQSEQPVITGSRAIEWNTEKLIESVPEITWTPAAPVSDVFISSSLQDLNHMWAARLVIVFSRDMHNILGHLHKSKNRIRTQCLVHVNADSASSGPWLRAFLSEWSRNRTFLDDAIEFANTDSQVTAKIVASTQSFILESPKFLAWGPNRLQRRLVDFDGFVSAPQRPSEFLEKDITIMRDLAPPLAGSPPSVRVLDARVTHGSRQIDTLPLQGQISILLDVSLKTPLHGSRPAFPEDQVEWEGDSKVLQIHMLEFDRPSVSCSITVPRRGNSEIASFSYEIYDNLVDLRFLLSDGPSILQTARLRGNPGGLIEFYVESFSTPVQHAKQSFDVALLVNDSLGGQPSVTTLTKDGILLLPLSAVDVENSRYELLKILEGVVTNPDTPIAPVLLELANQGHMLLAHLKDNVEGWPDRIERIQLMTQSNAFFPLEYLYEGRVPESTKADLCPERRPCLESGEARSPCSIREEATFLCPMGFLGVSAIVERHTWQRGKPASIWVGLAQSHEERYKITDLKKAVFSASNRADHFFDDDLPAGMTPIRIDDISRQLKSNCLTDWTEWKKQIAEVQPSLLVLLVHIENGQIFIGNEEGLNLAGLSTLHVGAGQPVAIAIGCSSGYEKIPGSSLPAALMRHGARVVVAAMTDVLGRHANRAALDLAERLRDATKSLAPIAVGELMNKLRRKFLVEDIAFGLALVAFGDADTILGGG
ncbi:hypothetical protein [Chromobacterium subtsugae]|uniref:hypothetical protein n=1 Tax=Chromobacterium subtsugae TaxID=251747 RepID=UPI000A62AAE7|nr:hypothetical protein [Chromobacterium subtsugae]